MFDPTGLNGKPVRGMKPSCNAGAAPATVSECKPIKTPLRNTRGKAMGPTSSGVPRKPGYRPKAH